MRLQRMLMLLMLRHRQAPAAPPLHPMRSEMSAYAPSVHAGTCGAWRGCGGPGWVTGGVPGEKFFLLKNTFLGVLSPKKMFLTPKIFFPDPNLTPACPGGRFRLSRFRPSWGSKNRVFQKFPKMGGVSRGGVNSKNKALGTPYSAVYAPGAGCTCSPTYGPF